MSSGVELVSLRYVVGLKSKSGPDVTAGLQKLVLNISRLFPVKVLHCDPGTEFGSDKLSSWLAQQGVRMQTTVPTDKQANGVAERTVGWMKARARTLLSATSTSPALWPLAMRYAAEAHNRQVLRQPPLPAFGQSVLHKLKCPSGANKELMVRWITATYAAPHLTIPDGHVLISSEGNLVASKGFRTDLVDISKEPGLDLPILCADYVEDETLDSPVGIQDASQFGSAGESVAKPPSRRFKEKTSVRRVSFADHWDMSPEQLSRAALLDEDYTDPTLRRILTLLESLETSSDDRRGEFEGRYVLGAYGHGGQRGITSLARKYPMMVKLINKVLRSRLPVPEQEDARRWSSLLLMHASDVPVHRDHRNEWGTSNTLLCVPGEYELWLGPPKDPTRPVAAPTPAWDSQDVHRLGCSAVTFNPRNYHAVRRTSDWLLVGYSPLGVQAEDRSFLGYLGSSCQRFHGINPRSEPYGQQQAPSTSLPRGLEVLVPITARLGHHSPISARTCRLTVILLLSVGTLPGILA